VFTSRDLTEENLDGISRGSEGIKDFVALERWADLRPINSHFLYSHSQRVARSIRDTKSASSNM
jgi:hypothetical protein